MGAQAVQPKIANMYLVWDLQKVKNENLREQVFSHLEPGSMMKMVRSLDYQLQDLHGGNLGFHPVFPPELEEYSSNRYYRSNSEDPLSLVDVYLDYCSKSQSTFYTESIEKGQQSSSRVDLSPDSSLAKVFDKICWAVDLFDIDVSFNISNKFVSHEGRVVAPIRSCIFTLPSADQELTDDQINELLQDKDKLDVRWTPNAGQDFEQFKLCSLDHTF